MKAKLFIAIAERGAVPKRSCGILVEDESGRAHILAEKFLGKCSEVFAMGFALRQSLLFASNIKKEVVEIITEENRANLFLQEPMRSRDIELSEISNEILALQQKFKKCVARKAKPKELDRVYAWAQKTWGDK